MRATLLELWHGVDSHLQSLIIGVGSLVVAYILAVILEKTIVRLARRTKSELDDFIAHELRRPLFVTIFLMGLSIALHRELNARAYQLALAGLRSIGVWVWAVAAYRIVILLLRAMSRTGAIVQQRTLPIFELLCKLVVVGAAIYAFFISWNIDLTAWMASAGIVGLALGFAAKDTLANLFAGISLIADGSYKVGDWVRLDNGFRGKVTRVGMRSTRVLTLDEIEVAVPNSIFGNSMIINEAGGPSPKQRVAVKVGVSYSSNIARVKDVLVSCALRVDGVEKKPAPTALMVAFGDSSLDFKLLVWIEEAHRMEIVVDHLHTAIFDAFAAADIVIPFPQRDLHFKNAMQLNQDAC